MGYAEWMAGKEDLSTFKKPTFGAGSMLGAAGSGAASGAAGGSMFEPWGSLIGAGVGAVSGLIGAGMKGNAEKEQYEREMAERKRMEEEQKRQEALNRGERNRDRAMSGIEMLAGMRDRAMRDYRNQTYRDGVVKLLQGAA